MKIKVNRVPFRANDPEPGSGRSALSSNGMAEEGTGREERAARAARSCGYTSLPMIFFSGLLNAHIERPAEMPSTVSSRKNDSFDQRV
jgi:hypothetical protein